jgi:hypothetical protein
MRTPRAITFTRLCALGIALAVLSNACAGFGPSKDEAKQLVALSLSSDADLQLAAFTGTFCESDDGRRLRAQSQSRVAVPSNAGAFGRMADNGVLKTLIANGYVDVKEETLAPDEGEERHPSCGKRDVCARCPTISKYYVATYELTPKGKGLFLVTPVAEGDFMRLYNSDTIVPFDDVQQAFGDDMPLTISVTIGTKAFDVTTVTTDFRRKTARVDYEWYWKPAPLVEKTVLKQMIPPGRNRATVSLKQLDDGWHLERDDVPPSQ